MDLANLNVTITETGAQAAIDALENIGEAAVVVSSAISNVIRSLDALSTVSGVASITDAVEKLSTSTTQAATQQEILATAMNKTSDSIIANQISYERLLSSQAAAMASTSALQESMGMLGSASAVLGEKQMEAKISVDALTTSQRSSLTAMYGATDAMRSMTAEEAKAAIQGNSVAQSNIQLAIDTEKLAQAQNKTQLSVINLTMAEEKLATQMARTQLIQNQSSAVFEKANLLQTQNAAAALRSADAHDKESTALNTNQTQHRENTAAIEKHTGSWITHIATVAGGIIVYQGIREAMRLVIGFFTEGVKSVAEYEDSIISLAATWTTMAKNQTDIPATFENSVKYAEQLLPVLMDIDRYTGMTLNQSLQLTTALATRGVVLNKDNQEQIQGYTDLSNAILIMTKGQGTGRQIMQETKALMEGSVKAGNELANMINANMNGKLKENIELWKQEGAAIGDSGYVLAKLEPYLSGYTAAMEKLKGSWSVMMSSLETTWQVLQRETFTPILKDWKASLQSINDYLKENSKEISGNVQNAWNNLRSILEAVYDNWDKIKTVTEVVLGAMAVQQVGLFITSLVTLTEYLAGLSIAVGELGLVTAVFGAISAPVIIATAAVVGLGVAVYELVTNWEYVKTAWDNFIFDLNSNSGVLATISNYLQDIIGKNNEWLSLFPPTQEALLGLDKGNPILDALGAGFDRLKIKIAPFQAALDVMLATLHLIDGTNLIQGKMDRVVNGASYAGLDDTSKYDSKGRLRINADGTPILTGAQSSSSNSASWDSFQMNMANQQAGYSSTATQPVLKPSTDAAKTTKTAIENFTDFNALTDEINRVNEAQSKLSDSSLTLAESDATLSKAQVDYNEKLTLAEALHEANLSKSDETLADKNNEKAATDALKDSYKVYTDELSVNTKIKAQATEDDKTAQKSLDELTKTLGLYRDAYMPLDVAVNQATVAQANQTQSIEDLKAAYEEQKKAIAEYGIGSVEAKTATEDYELALKHNIATTIISTNSDIDLKASKKGVTDEATKANKKISDFNDTLSEYGTAAGLSSKLTKVLEDQFKDLNKVGADTNNTFLKLSTTLTSVGTVLGGRLGTALSDIGKGLTGLNAPAIKNADGTINQQATDNQTALSYGAIGNGIGQAIGGKTGNAISSAASAAATGFMVAGPPGAAIAAAASIVSSIFGGSGRDTTNLDNTNTASRQSIEQLATSGSAIAMQIMAAAGYTDSGLKELRTTSTGVSAIGLPSSLTGGSQTSLFDNDWTGKKGQDLVQYIQNLTLIDTALKSMSSATIVTTLEQISYKWDGIIAQIGDSADVQQAKLNEQITAITGISAQSVGAMIDGVITSTPTGEAGTAFATKMEESIATAVRGMVISQTITSAIMPVLQSAIGPLVTALIANPSGENISGLIQNVNAAITGLSPVINSLQTALDGLGVAGNESTKTTTTLTDATAAATHTITDFSGTLTSSLNSAFSNGIDAVTQFQADFSSSIKSALLSSIESSFSTAILSPALQPIYDAMGSAFSGGVVNPSILTEILANAESTLVNLSPAVNSLFNTLGSTGMFSSSATTSATTSATATAPATDSLQSQIDAAVQTATGSLTKQVTDLQAQIDKLTSDAQTASSTAANDAQTAWQSAIAPLLDYQKNLFTTASTSAMSGQGLLYAQQSVVDRLVQEALSSTQDVRINAVGQMSGAIGDVLSTARNITTDPLEYARIVARESSLITNVTKQDATNSDIKDAIVDLKGVIQEGQNAVNTINYAIRDFQINGIKTI